MNSTITLLLLVISLFTFNCNDKTEVITEPSSTEDGSVTLTDRACYFSDIDSIQKKLTIKISLPSSREVEEINMLMNYVALPQNFSLFRGEVDNELATLINNQRIIIYNKELFAQIDRRSESYWTSLFIIAHEIGHHLAYNISDTSDRKNDELEADIFAGSLLYKMGADSNQVIAAVSSNLISQVKDSKTHPAKGKRIEAVKKSWYDASRLRYQSAIPPPPNDAGEVTNEFYEQELYTVTDVFGPIDTHRDYTANNVEGIILDVDRTQTINENKELETETTIKVLITNEGKSDNLVNRNEVVDLRVAFSSNIYREKDFNNFLKGGRRFKFSLVAVRPGIMYLLKVDPDI